MKLEVKIATSNPLDFSVEGKIGRGGDKDDEEPNEEFRVLSGIRQKHQTTYMLH